ncbi:MAG TPA: helix-turn-helix transcriptional regulator [Candidatus Limnocylindrales bacterium]|jgi:AraC-like DNA-binding protein|nr:helix-turn-helix transcriptional regulator [Candidatus Limnocylindrales bacterium]
MYRGRVFGRVGSGPRNCQFDPRPLAVMTSRLDDIDNWADRARCAKFHISALALECNISERQLRRYIESRFGLAPHVWMMQYRLREAQTLFSQGLRTKEIADQLNFRSSQHFSRAFKNHFGMSPRAFRKARLRKL